MSALGHKRTFALHQSMSALPPIATEIADIVGRSPRIFINVGGRASIPDMPGIGIVNYLTNTSILKLDIVPQHLVVVGGSYIGLEFAQMYRRFGADVTVV